MEQTLSKIITNLKEGFEGEPWYGVAVMNKLEALDWEKVNTKPMGTKSMAVLVQHMINWRIFVLRKLEGDAGFDIKMDSADDWTPVHINNETEWELLKASIRQTHTDILHILENSNEELLEKKVPGKGYDFESLLIGISQHDVYHMGQIALLNSLIKT